MPKQFYCLKCSKAKYKHSQWCRNSTTLIFFYDLKGNGCEPDDPNIDITRTQIFKPHELKDLYRRPYCRWERDYSRLRRVYERTYNPNGWNAVGWYCPRCGNFIKTN